MSFMPWNEVIHWMILKEINKDHCKSIIDHCRKNKVSICDCDAEKIKTFVNKRIVATPDQQKSIYKAFENAVNGVMEQIRDNEINIKSTDNKYHIQKRKMCKITLESMHTINAPKDDEIESEELSRLFMRIPFNIVLQIRNFIVKLQFECINHGYYDVMSDKSFIKAVNTYIRYNIKHYIYNDKDITINFMQIINQIQRRFLPIQFYVEMIREIDINNNGKKEIIYDENDDDNDDDEAADYGTQFYKDNNFRKDDGKINISMRVAQRYIYLSFITFLRKAFTKNSPTNCGALFDVESFQRHAEKHTYSTFDTFMNENIELFDVRPVDKQKSESTMIYYTINKLGEVQATFIEREKIKVDLTAKQNEEYYVNNQWFDILKAKKISANNKNVVVLIYKFGNEFKMYWIYYGCPVPIEIKDIFVSRWWKLIFKDKTNSFNTNNWIEEVKPDLMQRFREYLWNNNKLNHLFYGYLNKELHLHCIESTSRLSHNNDLFAKIYRNFQNDHKNDMDIKTFSVSEKRMKVEVSFIKAADLLMHCREPFDDVSQCAKYLKNTISMQMYSDKMQSFMHKGIKTGIVDTGLHSKSNNDRLYAIMKAYEDLNKLEYDNYATLKQIFINFPGFDINKLTPFNAANMKKKATYLGKSESKSNNNDAKKSQAKKPLISDDELDLSMLDSLKLPTITINIKPLGMNQIIQLTIDPNIKIKNIKKDIEIELGCHARTIVLIYEQTQLENDKTFSDYNIKTNSKLYLVLVLEGAGEIEIEQKCNDNDDEKQQQMNNNDNVIIDDIEDNDSDENVLNDMVNDMITPMGYDNDYNSNQLEEESNSVGNILEEQMTANYKMLEIIFTQQLIHEMEEQNESIQELVNVYEGNDEINDNGMQYFSYEDPPW